MTAGALLAIPSTAGAQSVYAGLSFLTGYPHGEFKQNVDHAGFGGEGHVGYHFGAVPLVLGAEIGVMSYGSNTRREPFSTTIPDVTVSVETSHNIAHGNLFLRLQPDEGVVRPYAEGVLGTNYFFTQTTIQNSDWNSGEHDNSIASTTNQDDWGLMYGVGAGLMVRVFDNDDAPVRDIAERETTGIATGFVTLGFRYLYGGKAEYLTNGSIRRNNGTVTYDVTSSRTDLLTGQLGFEVRF